MKKAYDDIITKHYKQVAQEEGLAATSTMADNTTRELETAAIIDFVGEALRLHEAKRFPDPAMIIDVGCGNGYTLDQLAQRYRAARYIGVEKSNELRELALSRFNSNGQVEIIEGDIRDNDFMHGMKVDILICQRVLINLLNREDQRTALENIIEIVRSPTYWRSGGTLLFIEGFTSSLDLLNQARGEFDLPPIPPADHNLYLPDDFFKIQQLVPFRSDVMFPPNFLSTHYYVTRILHEIFARNRPLRRNSEFVQFLTYALNQNIGDYSPLKLYVYEKQ